MYGTLKLLKIMSSLLSVPDIFQHQGSGNSFRGAKGSVGDGATYFTPLFGSAECAKTISKLVH